MTRHPEIDSTPRRPEILDTRTAPTSDLERRILFWSRSRCGSPVPADEWVRTCPTISWSTSTGRHRLCGEEHCPLHRSIVTDGEPGAAAGVRPTQAGIASRSSVPSPIRNAGQVVGHRGVPRSDGVMTTAPQAHPDHTLESQLPKRPLASRSLQSGGDRGGISTGGSARSGPLRGYVADVMGMAGSALYTMQLRSLGDCRRNSRADGVHGELNQKIPPPPEPLRSCRTGWLFARRSWLRDARPAGGACGRPSAAFLCRVGRRRAWGQRPALACLRVRLCRTRTNSPGDTSCCSTEPLEIATPRTRIASGSARPAEKTHLDGGNSLEASSGGWLQQRSGAGDLTLERHRPSFPA